jgi:hypothetical protein
MAYRFQQVLLDIQLTHQTLAFVWETGGYFQLRRTADTELMPPDGALKTRSKGTAAVFPITRSFLCPILVSVLQNLRSPLV